MTPGAGPTGPDRSRRRLLVAVPTAAIGALVLGCSSGDDRSSSVGDTVDGSTPSGTQVSSGSVADSSGSGWPFYGHDLAQTRTNVAETAITAATVATLTTRWTITELVGVTGTPTVVDGVAHFADELYIVDGAGHTWPGKPQPAFEAQFGTGTTEIDASALSFAFFFDPAARSR